MSIAYSENPDKPVVSRRYSGSRTAIADNDIGRAALTGEEPIIENGHSSGSGILLIAILVLAYVCAFADRTVITLLVDPIKADFRISDSEVSLITGVAFGVFYVVFTIPAGIIADRVGRRGLIGGSVAAWSGMSILAGLSGSFWQLFAGRAGVGIAEAFITPACFSLIRDRLPAQQRNRAFTVMGMAPFIGGAIAMIGGGAILGAAARGGFAEVPLLGALRPWQTVLVMLGSAGLPIALLPLLLRRDVRAPVLDNRAEIGSVLRHMMARGRSYALLIVYATAGSVVGFAMGAWVPAMMSRKFALSLDQVGLVAGGITITAAPVGMMLGGVLIDRLIAAGRDIRAYGGITMAIGTACAIGMTNVATAPAAWALYAAAIFFTSSVYPIGATTLADLTPGRFMGKVTVVYFVPQNILGGALAATIVAVISDTLFSGPAAISHALGVHCAVFGTIAAIAALLLGRSLSSRGI